MYYSAIGTLALLILLIENQDIFLNRGDVLENSAWMIYRKFLFAVVAYYITDIFWGLIEASKLGPLLFADTTVYFCAMAAGILFWSQFAVAYLDERNAFGRFLVNAGRFLAGLIVLLNFINIFRPVIFTVDSACVYRALPARYVSLTLQILLLLIISAYTFSAFLRQENPELRRRRYRALGAFGLIMAVCLFAQLWFPYLPLYAIAYLLGTSLLHTLVVNIEKEEFRAGREEASRIEDSQKTIASLFDNMPGMTFTKDAETGTYLTCNMAFAKFANRSAPEEVVGLTDADLFGAESAERYAREDQVALAMDEPYIFYEDVTGADGSHRQFQTTKRKYTDARGRQCILGIYQDVTDMVRIQRENATTKEAYEKARSTGIIYTHIAQALARSYFDLYYVNLDSEEYIEYRPDEESGLLREVSRGWHFFEWVRAAADKSVDAEDRDNFVEAMDRRTLLATLDRNKTLVMTYRYLSESGPIYITMKVSRMGEDDRYIIVGMTNVDDEMKQQRAADRMKEEQVAYGRLSALTGEFLCVYIVVPETGRFREISSTAGYAAFGQAGEGSDFFEALRDDVREFSHPDDLGRVLAALTMENVMEEIEQYGIFTLTYRIMMEGRPVYVQFKAAMVEEKEGARLVAGLINIDSQIRQEEEYVKKLSRARIEANVDPLTGVKNRHAYLMAEERLNVQIEDGHDPEFAIAILDVNDLKIVNDNEGHNAGDQYLRDACKIICDTFKHSPVFRIGGDEFAVIAQGNDYGCIDELIGRMEDHNAEAVKNGGIVIACGMSKRDGDDSVAPVFERADHKMYDNKTELKEVHADEAK